MVIILFTLPLSFPKVSRISPRFSLVGLNWLEEAADGFEEGSGFNVFESSVAELMIVKPSWISSAFEIGNENSIC